MLTRYKTVLLCTRQQMYCQHDEAPPYFITNVTRYLHETFLGRQMGRDDTLNLPQRSADLRPLDYYYRAA
jgi:hypothetical protein